jgi:hypothetical protein
MCGHLLTRCVCAATEHISARPATSTNARCHERDVGFVHPATAAHLRGCVQALPEMYEDPRQPPAVGGYGSSTGTLSDAEQYQPGPWPYWEESEIYADDVGRSSQHRRNDGRGMQCADQSTSEHPAARASCV